MTPFKGYLLQNEDNTYTAPEVINVSLFTDVIVDELTGIGNGKCCYLTGEDSGVSKTALASITNPTHVPALGVSTEAKIDGEIIRLCNRGSMPFDTTTLTGTPAIGDVLYLQDDGDLDREPLDALAGNFQVARVEKLGVNGSIFIDLHSFALYNNFDGILRSSIQNENTGENATTAFTSINDVGDQFSIGVSGSGNTASSPRASAILSTAPGGIFNVNVSASSWKWQGLFGEIMELTPQGFLSLLNAGVGVDRFLDEDDFASDSDEALATQQSIKAYTSRDRQIAVDQSAQMTSSSTFADIPNATITTKDLGQAGNYTVEFATGVSPSVANTDATFRFLVNGSPVDVERHITLRVNGAEVAPSFLALLTGLVDGDVITVQWATDKGTVTMDEFNFLIDGMAETRIIV